MVSSSAPPPQQDDISVNRHQLIESTPRAAGAYCSMQPKQHRIQRQTSAHRSLCCSLPNHTNTEASAQRGAVRSSYMNLERPIRQGRSSMRCCRCPCSQSASEALHRRCAERSSAHRAVPISERSPVPWLTTLAVVAAASVKACQIAAIASECRHRTWLQRSMSMYSSGTACLRHCHQRHQPHRNVYTPLPCQRSTA